MRDLLHFVFITAVMALFIAVITEPFWGAIYDAFRPKDNANE